MWYIQRAIVGRRQVTVLYYNALLSEHSLSKEQG